MVRGSNPGKEKGFFLNPERPDRLWGTPTFLLNGSRGSFPGLKRTGRDVDNSSPSSAEVKNEWSYTSTPPLYLHGLDRFNCTLNFTVLFTYLH